MLFISDVASLWLTGRGFGRGGNHFHSANFHRGRGFHQHGHGQFSRMGHNEHGFGNRYNEFRGRPYFGRGSLSLFLSLSLYVCACDSHEHMRAWNLVQLS